MNVKNFGFYLGTLYINFRNPMNFFPSLLYFISCHNLFYSIKSSYQYLKQLMIFFYSFNFEIWLIFIFICIRLINVYFFLVLLYYFFHPRRGTVYSGVLYLQLSLTYKPLFFVKNLYLLTFSIHKTSQFFTLTLKSNISWICFAPFKK